MDTQSMDTYKWIHKVQTYFHPSSHSRTNHFLLSFCSGLLDPFVASLLSNPLQVSLPYTCPASLPVSEAATYYMEKHLLLFSSLG